MELEQHIIDEIVRRLTAAAPVDRIILFGSAANGTMTPDSDVDLLVLKRDIQNVRDERLQLRKALRELDYPVDVLLMTRARFDETKNIMGGISYPADKEGRVIYGAA